MTCRVPLIKLTDCDGRIMVRLSNCDCTAETTELRIIRDGCKEFQEKVIIDNCVNHSFGCCTPCLPSVRVVQEEVPKPTVTYPLHEIDCNGRAVFVFDGKLKAMGYGRYKAEIVQNNCSILQFNIDYQCGTGEIFSIETQTVSNMGERC